MLDIRSEMVSRIVSGRREFAEKMASEIVGGMLADIDFLKRVYAPDFLSKASYDTAETTTTDSPDTEIKPGTKDRGSHKSEQYQEGISYLFYQLLDRSFKPRGSALDKEDAKASYLGRQDVEDAITGAYRLFKARLKKDFIANISERLKLSYSPYEYKLYRSVEKEGRGGQKSGRWELVDSIMSEKKMKKSEAEVRQEFIKKFKNEGLETADLEQNFDQHYMIKAERKDVFEDLGITLDKSSEDEVTDDLINRMLRYYISHPDQFEKVMVQAVMPSKSSIKTKDKPVKPTDLKGKDKKDERVYKGEDEDIEAGGTTLGMAWFRPLKEGERVEEQEIRGLTRRKENIDQGVLSYMKSAGAEGHPIPWEYQSVNVIQGKDPTVKYDYETDPSELGPIILMEFKLPDYKKGRVFKMAIPSDLSAGIRDKRPGETSTMTFRGYSPDKGILVQFNELADKKKLAILREIEEGGIPAGKMPKLVYNMSQYYLIDMAPRSQAGLGKVLEDFAGVVALGGTKIESESQLDGIVGEYIADRNAVQRDTDLIQEMIQSKEMEESRRETIRQEYGPETAKALERSDTLPQKIDEIATTISREFPVFAEFNNIKEVGFERALITAPTIHWIVSTILDETLIPLTQTGKVPWKEFTEQLMKSHIFMDPKQIQRYLGAADVSNFFTAMSIVKAKADGVPTEDVLKMVEGYKRGQYKLESKDYPEIVKFIRTGFQNIPKVMQALNKEIMNVMLELYKKNDPLIKKIFYTSPGLEGKVKGVSKAIYQKRGEYRQKLEQLEDALMDRDFETADGILKEVKIKAGTLLGKLVKARYAPGGEGIDEASSGVIDQILQSYEEKTDGILDEMYQSEIGKVTGEGTEKMASGIYMRILERGFHKCAYSEDAIYSLVHGCRVRIA